MKKLFVLLILPFLVHSQSLGKERIRLLDNSIVRIYIENQVSGTGFMVNKNGLVATCHHVVYPAFIWNAKNKYAGMKKIFVEFDDGEKIEVKPTNHFLNNQTGYYDGKALDVMLLKLQSTPNFEYEILKMSKWDTVNEGDAIYTCGFPLSINVRFISKGVLSTKWIKDYDMFSNGKLFKNYEISAAWADITLNRGNSGGPIIKMGKKPKEDVVIGLASFLHNPGGNDAEKFSKAYRDAFNKTDNKGAKGLYKQWELVFNSVSNNSLGISGIISVDYLVELLQK
nr:serine protease [uncultured Allomuricauda sp.]